MDVGLPRETQQIDRVMEAFAARYLQCHMNLFTSDGMWISLLIRRLDIHFAYAPTLDHPYVLAFSLIMLHTDAFNKSNKRKMSKADYVRNTRLPGVAPEVLDVRHCLSQPTLQITNCVNQCYLVFLRQHRFRSFYLY